MKKVKFLKDFVHGAKLPDGNHKVDKKGKTKLVTDKHATFLERNKMAVIVDKDEKEDKGAADRDTK